MLSRFQHQSPFSQDYKHVPGEGPRPARCMLVGERPGRNEARVGRPFVGDAGDITNTCLAAADLDRKNIYITNLVKTYREYSKPTREEIEEGLPELIAEIDAVQPEVIGLLGTYAVEAVLGKDRAELAKTHGVPVHFRNGTVALPMHHPAAGLYAPATLSLILDDFLRLAQLLAGEISVVEDVWKGREKYRELPVHIKAVSATSGIDTEGTRKKPWCLTVSTRAGEGWLVKPGRKFIVRSPKVYLHNSLHDLGVLREMGVELGEDQFVDTMVLAYQLCVEPQGLKALAYRWCGAEQAEYEEVIGEAGREKAIRYLEQVSQVEWPKPEQTIIIAGGSPRAYKPQSLNKRVAKILKDLSSNGTHGDPEDAPGGKVCDPRQRWGDISDELKAPAHARFGSMPETTLDDIPYEKALTYACRDADITRRIGPILEQRVKDMGLERSVKVDHDILPMVDRMQTVGIQLAGTEFWDDIDRQCDAQMGKSKYQVYQMTGKEINPASGDQVAALLYDDLGLKPPYMTEGGGRGSVDGTCLEQLLSQAPVVQPIMDYTEAQKIKSTYVEPLRKLAVTGERAHSTFRVTRTTTGRLSMADPPLHQIPIMTELGRQIRGGFVAPEGKVLYDADWDQIEMRLMAHDSKDPELCRLFNESRDIHTETAAKMFSVPVGSIEGKGDIRRTVAKHAGFGIINGITEYGLVNYMILNRCRRPDGEAWTLDDCVMLIREWFNIYKGVKRFHNQCIAETRATGLARESISGRIVYLPAVWSPDKQARETAERMSYVMHTQGGAASLIKKCMKNVWDTVCRIRGLGVEPLLWVHDELLLECPDDPRIAEIDRLMTAAMENTVRLRVPVKVSSGVGRNWLTAH